MSLKSWNYRVIEFVCPENNEPWRQIHEVHYEDGKPVSYSENAAPVYGNTDDELYDVLELMREAIEKKHLVESDFMGGAING
ncbi:MAG: hypothetical protein HYZ45_12615 [Burkholderiales bacterium]|nr:hypothetical protein [Burkholderiales bacterium]